MTAPSPHSSSPNPVMKQVIADLCAGRSLPSDQAEAAFTAIMSGEASAAQIGAFLAALRVKGETIDEIAAGARVMRAKATAIEAPVGAIDTCGTGGDASGTYNISTAVALVVAAVGVPVAKHGNRALSSKSGSADVLAALGVNIDCSLDLTRQSLWENKIGFLMAPRHHSAMRHVAAARAELGTRTIFNLLGPLSNPAQAKRQLIGVFSSHWLKPLAHVLGRLGAERAWIVHGSDGLDELTTTGPSQVAEWNRGQVRSFILSPADAGLPLCQPEELKGGNAHYNAAALKAVLEGKKGAYRDIVVLNAAAALMVAEQAEDLRHAAAIAIEAIDSGKAKAVLDRLIAITNQAAMP